MKSGPFWNQIIEDVVTKLLKINLIREVKYPDWLAIVVDPQKNDRGNYCYNMIPFSLKSTDVMYQRLVNQMIKDYIGKAKEVYIEDILVKLIQVIDHLRKTFMTLRRYNMKSNSTKCISELDSINKKDSSFRKIHIKISKDKS